MQASKCDVMMACIIDLRALMTPLDPGDSLARSPQVHVPVCERLLPNNRTRARVKLYVPKHVSPHL